jgi:hypothetical protein
MKLLNKMKLIPKPSHPIKGVNRDPCKINTTIAPLNNKCNKSEIKVKEARDSCKR